MNYKLFIIAAIACAYAATLLEVLAVMRAASRKTDFTGAGGNVAGVPSDHGTQRSGNCLGAMRVPRCFPASPRRLPCLLSINPRLLS